MFQKKLAMTALAAVMTLGAVAVPVTAFAAGTTGATEVKVTVDDSNLTVTVPTVIPFSMDAAGVLTSGEVGNIVNGSNFSIHVKEVAVQQASPFNLVADAEQATEDNAISFQFGKEGALMDAKTPTAAVGQYDLAPTGAEGDKIAIVANGKAKNVKADIGTAQKVADITWTFAAGKAK